MCSALLQNYSYTILSVYKFNICGTQFPFLISSWAVLKKPQKHTKSENKYYERWCGRKRRTKIAWAGWSLIKKKMRKCIAYVTWNFPRIITRKLSFLYQKFHMFHIKVKVLPPQWKLLEYPIFEESVCIESHVRTATMEELVLKFIFWSILLCYLRFRAVFLSLCLFTTSCFAEGSKRLQHDTSLEPNGTTHTASELPSYTTSGSTKDQLRSFGC